MVIHSRPAWATLWDSVSTNKTKKGREGSPLFPMLEFCGQSVVYTPSLVRLCCPCFPGVTIVTGWNGESTVFLLNNMGFPQHTYFGLRPCYQCQAVTGHRLSSVISINTGVQGALAPACIHTLVQAIDSIVYCISEQSSPIMSFCSTLTFCHYAVRD